MISAFLSIALVVVFVVTVYHDFKSRSIFWWLPVLAFVLGFLISGQSLSVSEIMLQIVVNLCFVLLILSVALLYFFIRYKSISTFMTRQFGAGDALMLLAICPLLPLPNFILFFVPF